MSKKRKDRRKRQETGEAAGGGGFAVGDLNDAQRMLALFGWGLLVFLLVMRPIVRDSQPIVRVNGILHAVIAPVAFPELAKQAARWHGLLQRLAQVLHAPGKVRG